MTYTKLTTIDKKNKHIVTQPYRLISHIRHFLMHGAKLTKNKRYKLIRKSQDFAKRVIRPYTKLVLYIEQEETEYKNEQEA